MNYILFDDTTFRQNLLPLTYTRPIADIRCGIFTMRERWQSYLKNNTSTLTQAYLQAKYPLVIEAENIFINASIFANERIVKAIQLLNNNEKLIFENKIIAYKSQTIENDLENYTSINFTENIQTISQLTDIFSLNDFAIKVDYQSITANRTSAKISSTNTLIGTDIFVEEGAKVEASILNATSGPIYIGKNAEIMEGCMIRGALALCDGAQLKMGTKIYGATTLGPGCKAGGEVNNTVFFANSSKAHDGFVGNSVIGEWCNMGADSNNSNLKNNYEEVKLWSEAQNKFIKTGLQFCGLIMADHSKCGINTMFNTGTVVGVCCNIYGAGFPRNYIPSFAWGGASTMLEYKLNKAFETIEKVFARRNLTLDAIEKNMLTQVFESTNDNRNF